MRLTRLASLLAALCLVSLLAVLFLDRPVDAKRVPSVVRARAFELVDRNGQARMQIEVERNGEVVLRLRDQDGAIRVKLGASRTGSGLLLLNEATEPGVQALAGAERTSLSLQRGAERNELVP
jgi:hypothetical protein